MRPIETVYRSITFRSRTEARWAVFFDSFGIAWTYEQHAVPFNGGVYIPDFHFTKDGYFAEVKPVWPTKFETDKMRAAATYSNGTFLLMGIPDFKYYWMLTLDDERPMILDSMRTAPMDRPVGAHDFGMAYHIAVEKAKTFQFDGYDDDRRTIAKRYS